MRRTNSDQSARTRHPLPLDSTQSAPVVRTEYLIGTYYTALRSGCTQDGKKGRGGVKDGNGRVGAGPPRRRDFGAGRGESRAGTSQRRRRQVTARVTRTEQPQQIIGPSEEFSSNSRADLVRAAHCLGRRRRQQRPARRTRRSTRPPTSFAVGPSPLESLVATLFLPACSPSEDLDRQTGRPSSAGSIRFRQMGKSMHGTARARGQRQFPRPARKAAATTLDTEQLSVGPRPRTRTGRALERASRPPPPPLSLSPPGMAQKKIKEKWKKKKEEQEGEEGERRREITPQARRSYDGPVSDLDTAAFKSRWWLQGLERVPPAMPQHPSRPTRVSMA
ncbi:hypothetical protein CDD83_2710 [Cordyceps sp. RAO-2017]|nr:hypothetical protein CDD83_2710 [Cordyceps sp. RAO-2017]